MMDASRPSQSFAGERPLRAGPAPNAAALATLLVALLAPLVLGGCFVFAGEGTLEGGDRDTDDSGRGRDLGEQDRDPDDTAEPTPDAAEDAAEDPNPDGRDTAGDPDATAQTDAPDQADDAGDDAGDTPGPDLDDDPDAEEPECRVHSDCTTPPRRRCGPTGECQEGVEGEACLPDEGNCKEGALYCASADNRCYDGSRDDPCDPGRFQCQEPLLECDEGGTCTLIIGL